MGKKATYLYIVGNKTGVLYIGITSDLSGRMQQHKSGAVQGFSKRYGTDRLLFFEEFNHPVDALRAERMLKGWRRSKKLELIRSVNPTFRDLSEDF